MNEWVALGSLAVAIVSLVLSYLRSNKLEVARDQKIEDKLDNQSDLLGDVKNTLGKLDGKIDDHSVRIARLEGELDNAYRRIDRIEGRCERHFGPSQHEG